MRALYEDLFKAKDKAARDKIYAEIDSENQKAAAFAIPNEMDKVYKQLGIRGVKRVRMHAPLTGGHKIFVVRLERGTPDTEVWRALYGVSALQRFAGKIVIATDEDIDPDNADAILWALSFRAKPHLDMEILRHQDGGHGPTDTVRGAEDSALLVNAMLRQDYPPISLPKREYMERAREIWENELNLQPLKPDAPWYGYSLGAWTDDMERQAQRAVRGHIDEICGWLPVERQNCLG